MAVKVFPTFQVNSVDASFQVKSVDAFKKSIKEWKPKNCSCRRQKKYIKFWVHLQLLRETF